MRVAAAGGSSWVILSLCAAAASLEGFDTQSLGVAAPRLMPEFGLSPSQIGWVLSAAPLGLFAGASIGGRLADFLGRKPILIGSLLLFGLFSLLTAATQGIETLFIARLATGAGLGGAMPNFISLASESVRSDRRLTSVTGIMAALPLGGALAALVALGDRLGWGWRLIFVVGGIGPILLGLVMMKALREPPRSEQGALPKPSLGRRSELESPSVVLFGARSVATTLLLWTAFFFTQLVLLLMLNWLPNLIVGLGFSRTQASSASLCFNLSGSAGAVLLAGLHAGRYRRLWIAATYIGMAASMGALASAAHEFPSVLLICAMAGAFIIGAQLILYALAPLYYARTNRGTGVGAAVAVGRLGSVAGPLVAGLVMTRGLGTVGVITSMLPFILVGGGAALALTWRSQHWD